MEVRELNGRSVQTTGDGGWYLSNGGKVEKWFNPRYMSTPRMTSFF